MWLTFSKCSPRLTHKPRLCPSTELGAYDSNSRKAMLEALIAMPGGPEALPFVRSFYGQPSRYVREDEFGEVHHIHQGEGVNRGTLSCPSCSPWANMQLWRRSGNDCSLERGSSLSWTTQLLIGSDSFTTSYKRSCIGIPESASTWGRLKFGMPPGTCLQPSGENCTSFRPGGEGVEGI